MKFLRWINTQMSLQISLYPTSAKLRKTQNFSYDFLNYCPWNKWTFKRKSITANLRFLLIFSPIECSRSLLTAQGHPLRSSLCTILQPSLNYQTSSHLIISVNLKNLSPNSGSKSPIKIVICDELTKPTTQKW